MNFPSHLIAGLDFPQIFIPATQGGPTWAVAMYLLIISAIFTWNCLQNLHRNILFLKLTMNSLKKLLILHFLGKYVPQTSLIMYLLLSLLSRTFQAFCSVEFGVKFYFSASLWHLNRVWLRLCRPS